MDKLLTELQLMLDAANRRVRHKWHDKDLTQVVNLAYIHAKITREEKDVLMMAASNSPYDVTGLIQAIKSV